MKMNNDNMKKNNDKKRKPYIKWTDEERYNVGKYASQNGIAAAVRHYQPKYKRENAHSNPWKTIYAW